MPQHARPSFPAFSILIVFLLLCLVGAALVPWLSIQLLPSRSYAAVSVSCQLPGASPQVTEQSVSTPIESALSRLKGVTHVSSTSGNGASYVTVSLDKWTDPELFRFEAASQMRQLYPELPSGASYPQVQLNKPDGQSMGGPLIGYTLSGPGSPNEVAAFAEDNLRPVLAGIPGIDAIDISGGLQKRWLISSSSDRLQQAGMTYETIQEALSNGMAQTDIGMVRTSEGRQNLFIGSSLRHVDDLANFPLTNRSGRLLRLQDVADIREDIVPPTSYYRINGQNLVSISISPESHVNSLQLAEKVRSRLETAATTLPKGYRLALSYDKTTYIKEELGKIYTRTGLSIAILLLFVVLLTRQLRYLIIVVASLAVNVLLSFILYYLCRLEIHLYSLAGITISLGMVIDNVIVIVEDIRHTGRNRIFAAILASTLTSLGALSVIFLLEESLRINLLDFALAIIVNLLVSLPIAYYFIPALLEKLPVSIKKSRQPFRSKRRVARFSHFYQRQLRFMGRFRPAFFALFILALGLPLFLLPEKVDRPESFWARAYNATLGSDFYRQYLREPLNKYLGGSLYLFRQASGTGYSRSDDAEQQVQLYVSISMPNGATLAQMDAVVKDFERFLQPYQQQMEVFTASVNSATSAFISISFKKGYRSSFPFQLKQLLETQAIYAGSADFSVYGVGQGFSNAINLNEYDSTIALKGYNYEQLNELALGLRDTLLAQPRVQDVFISSEDRYGQKLNYEYVLRFSNPPYLALLHTGRYPVGNAVNSLAMHSAPLGQVQNHEGEYLRLDWALNDSGPPGLWPLMHQPLYITDSSMVRLQGLSQIAQVKVNSNIRRENQEYLLNVHYRFIGTYLLNDLVRKRVISQLQQRLPIGYSVYNPDAGWTWGQDGNYQYLWFIPLVLLIIYMICAVLLESLRQPFAVILMIPFSFIGVFLVFYLLGLTFDQGGSASLLMLAGLVTNAALYIINDVNYLRKKLAGNGRTTGIRTYVSAFQAKAMPIMVTTASAILSLLPFMVSGEEKGFWFTLSAGTIGGLLFSLLGAYLLLPLCLVGGKGKRKK